MVVRRIVGLLYITAGVVFLVGVGLRIAEGITDIAVLDHIGSIMNVAAWLIALAGAIFDVLRHERHAGHAPHSATTRGDTLEG